MPDAGGVALFACEALGIREILPSRIPFENVFAVGETPLLRPLMELDASAPTTLVVFIDTESARLVALTAAGPGEEVALRSDVPGHHSRGGWAQLAQSRYRRHIQDHRARHFDAVVETLTALVDGHGVRRIVFAGEPRNVAVFRQELPSRLAALIVGIVAGAEHEEMGRIVARAAQLLPHAEGQREAEGVDGVLTAAAKHGKGAAASTPPGGRQSGRGSPALSPQGVERAGPPLRPLRHAPAQLRRELPGLRRRAGTAGAGRGDGRSGRRHRGHRGDHRGPPAACRGGRGRGRASLPAVDHRP